MILDPPTLWLMGFAAAGAVVLLVAALLIGILWQARRILRLARAVLPVVEAIELQTRPIWALRRTKMVAVALHEQLTGSDLGPATDFNRDSARSLDKEAG